MGAATGTGMKNCGFQPPSSTRKRPFGEISKMPHLPGVRLPGEPIYVDFPKNSISFLGRLHSSNYINKQINFDAGTSTTDELGLTRILIILGCLACSIGN